MHRALTESIEAEFSEADRKLGSGDVLSALIQLERAHMLGVLRTQSHGSVHWAILRYAPRYDSGRGEFWRIAKADHPTRAAEPHDSSKARSATMSAGHARSHGDSLTSEGRLWIALVLTATFLAVEVVASLLTGSLALLSDAGHMATDVAALGIALLAIKVGKRPADSKRSFGYRRLEILAAAMNAAGLFLVAGYVLIEAVRRIGSPQPVDSTGMLVVAGLGLVVNAIAMMLLRGGREESLNVRGAYLEVWADFLGSVAVLLGAVMIWLTERTWIDPAVAILIALWVLPRGWQLLKSASHVLLEGTPEGIDPEAVKRTLLAVSGVAAVHDLHIWSVTTGVPLLSAHLEVGDLAAWDKTLLTVREKLATQHHIDHVTLQPEAAGRCEPAQASSCRE